MLLSVIILNYNVRYFLELCLISVQKAIEGIDAEIIVVDNNSVDDSCAMVLQRFSTVKLIQNKSNEGFPKGNNIGVDQASGEYVCILNPDTVVAEDTFLKILEFAKTQDKLGIVGCKLIDGSGGFLPESKRGVPTPFVAFTKIAGLYKLFPKSKILGKYYANHLQEEETGKVDVLVGAFMLLKRKLYLELGGFDEACFMYSDDIDLSYMALKGGYNNYYFGVTTVIHYKGESTHKDGLYMRRFSEAMHFFYKKHFSASKSKFKINELLFAFFMKIGVSLFTIYKTIQGNSLFQKTKKIISPKYILFSNDQSLLQKMERSLQKKVKFHDLKTEKMLLSSIVKEETNVEIILDNEFISFKDCIAIQESAKKEGFNQRITFKIKPKATDFLIGSNNSTSRGEVVKMT
ncbi:glycosyltransferase family 2 protein [Flavobacterium tiangeerense]|uniref:glycosyltransferase family 2 protein n=1 Tax=Flavobacterium tiangeerense TaxID=459471 RepID=UPI00119DF3D0|nr:glycosyltransferase family 2 protein [Flavobacterium tiangeerense]